MNKYNNSAENIVILLAEIHRQITLKKRWEKARYVVDKEKAVFLYFEGLGANSIGKILNVPKEVVRRRLTNWGVVIDEKRRMTKNTKEIFERLRG